MVEVVTSEEFSEFQKSIEEKLDAINKNLNDLIKGMNENRDKTNTDLNKAMSEIYERIDELEGSNKGFIERLRDAINPHAAEPVREKEDSKPIEKTEKTLGKVAEVISRCPNFFDWDWCQVNCPLYQLCDNVSTVQDTSKLSQKGSIDRFKELLKQFVSPNHLKKDEYLPAGENFS
jgi:hypothetical protein